MENIIATSRNGVSHLSKSRSSLSSEPGLLNLDQPIPEPDYGLAMDSIIAWARRAPESVAISQGTQTWAYGELMEAAVKIAQQLISDGLNPGDVVAVTGRNSFGRVAAMVAAFLSGGVLLTIDRNMPISRQLLMLEQANARDLLSVGDNTAPPELLEQHAWRSRREISAMTGLAHSQPNVQWDDIPLPELTGDSPAYIFFTSGTTGVPKGVMGVHKGLSHFLTWQRTTFEIGPKDRIGQLTALSFDVVLRDIFLPLTSGATLCLPEETQDLGAYWVLSWLEQQSITILHTVPALAQSWLNSLPAGVSLRSLRWVFFAGEPLMETLVQEWRRQFPGPGQIVNLYGPTETTLAKFYYIVPANPRPGIQPVGRPLPETQVLLLNDNGELCGPGEPGEIAIRTPFRSLGYINAPEAQQKHFVANTFRIDKEDLLYRTGDRGRMRPDGLLEILGRIDHQIKISGVRIEPDEIAAKLGEHPAVGACIVLAHKDDARHYLLVACVVVAPEKTVHVDDLRTYLGDYFPAPMIPGRFIFLPELPLTRNGKVDRKALPAFVFSDGESPCRHAPRTEMEQAVHDIWAQVFGIADVDIQRGFWELGGDSLQAAQMISRLLAEFDVKLEVTNIFANPTIADLTVYVLSVLIDQADPEAMAELWRMLDKLTDEEAEQVLRTEKSFACR